MSFFKHRHRRCGGQCAYQYAQRDYHQSGKSEEACIHREGFNGKTVDAFGNSKGNRKFRDQVCYLAAHRTFPKNIYVKEIIDSGVLGNQPLPLKRPQRCVGQLASAPFYSRSNAAEGYD